MRGFYGSTHDARYHGIDPISGVNTAALVESLSTPRDVIDGSPVPSALIETIATPADLVAPTAASILAPGIEPARPTAHDTDYFGDGTVYVEDGGPSGIMVIGPDEHATGDPVEYIEVEPPGPGAMAPPLPDLPPGEPPTFLEQGEAAFAAANYEEARRLFRRAIIALPDDAYAQLDYGLAHFALGEYEIAANAIRRALTLDPDLLDRLPDMSTAYGKMADFDLHLAALNERLVDHPADTDARFLHGAVRLSVGEPQMAVSELSRALQRNSRDTVAYLLRDAALRSMESRRTTRTVVLRPQ